MFNDPVECFMVSGVALIFSLNDLLRTQQEKVIQRNLLTALLHLYYVVSDEKIPKEYSRIRNWEEYFFFLFISFVTMNAFLFQFSWKRQHSFQYFAGQVSWPTSFARDITVVIIIEKIFISRLLTTRSLFGRLRSYTYCIAVQCSTNLYWLNVNVKIHCPVTE